MSARLCDNCFAWSSDSRASCLWLERRRQVRLGAWWHRAVAEREQEELLRKS